MLINWLKTHFLYTIKKMHVKLWVGKSHYRSALISLIPEPTTMVVQVSQVSHASVAYVLACAGIGMSQIGFTCPSSVNTIYKAFNRRDKIFTVFAKKENISFVLFGLNCFHLGHLVVSVHDRLLTRKNRKLTYRKRKFKVSPRGSPVILFTVPLCWRKHTHTWMLPLVFEQTVWHSSAFPVLT